MKHKSSKNPRDVIDWLRSREGKRAMKEGLDAVEESEHKLRLSRMVKPEDLRRIIDV